MNQRELIESHTRLGKANWELAANQVEGVWFYSFSKNIKGNSYRVSLQKSGSTYFLVTTKNEAEYRDLEKSYQDYDQSIYAMEDICEYIDSRI
jgi:hypothetical protein